MVLQISKPKLDWTCWRSVGDCRTGEPRSQGAGRVDGTAIVAGLLSRREVD